MVARRLARTDTPTLRLLVRAALRGLGIAPAALPCGDDVAYCCHTAPHRGVEQLPHARQDPPDPLHPAAIIAGGL